MKNTKKVAYLLSFAVVLSMVFGFNQSFAYTSGKEVMTEMINSVIDENAPIPSFLKSVEKEYKDSNLKAKKYLESRNSTLEYISKLPERSVSSKKDALAVVSEVNKKIQELNKTKSESDKASTLFEKKAKNLSVGDPAIDLEFQKVFNQFITSKLKTFTNTEHTNTLEMLYKTRDFYTYLSKTKTRFTFLNGYPQFESSSDYYEYYMYMAKLRTIFKNQVNLELERADYFQNSDIKNVIDQKFVDIQNSNLEGNKKYIETWKAPGSYTDPNLSWIDGKTNTPSSTGQSELDIRRSRVTSLQNINQEIKNINQEYADYGSYNKDRFASKENLKKALALSQKMLSLYKQSDAVDYPIRVQYNKDFPVMENIFNDVMQYSDVDFSNLYVYIQRNALYNESIDLDVKLYNLALANYGKFTNNFESKDAQYPLSFKSKTASNAYKKILDGYNSRFAELFDYIDKYNTQTSTQNTSGSVVN